MKKNNSNPKKILAAVPAAALVGALGVAGVAAYFTDTEGVVNRFTVADGLDIELTEPAWDEANAQSLAPLAVVAKDPRITNVTDDVEAYMFMEVSIPVATVDVADANNSYSTVENAELFKLMDKGAFGVDENWTLLNSSMSEDGKYMVYLYVFNEIVDPGESTTALFDNVQLINLVDETLGESAAIDIPVNAYGIQAEGFANAQAAWAAYMAQNA